MYKTVEERRAYDRRYYQKRRANRVWYERLMAKQKARRRQRAGTWKGLLRPFPTPAIALPLPVEIQDLWHVEGEREGGT